MALPLAALVTGGLSLAGGLMSGIFSARQATQNRNFQERMSNTSYQRAMADMRAAGLNPMLAYKTGGAGTPTGAMGSMPDPITPGINTAVSVRRNKAEIKNMGAQYDNIMAEQQLKDEQRGIATEDIRIKRNKLDNARKDATIARIDNRFYRTPVGVKARQAELLANSARSAAAIIKPFTK